MAYQKIKATMGSDMGSAHNGKDKQGPELFLALVGPVGTDLRTIFHSMKRVLRGVAYEAKEIRLSKNLSGNGEPLSSHEDERIENLMKAGDELRAKMKRGDAVAALSISDIIAVRESGKTGDEATLPRTAYVFNSLKHPDEVTKLRDVYGDSLVVISIHTPAKDRITFLSQRIAKTHTKIDPTKFEDRAKELVSLDYKASGEYGQNVMETFPLADFFIDGNDDIDRQVKRFIDVLFGSPFITPNVDEYGMFFAKAASFRSSDLSRQVGAMIMTDEGEIISAGCNEVPEAGGGHAWENKTSPNDNRDFKVGQDANAVMKHEIITEVFDALRQANWLSDDKKKLSSDDLMNLSLYGDERKDIESVPPLKGKKIANIIEFGRIIHAEMSAITDAARRGLNLKNTTLYCTTFPCHMCARHIIAAGIERTVYIEPYEKSFTKTLYSDQIQFDATTPSDGRMSFHPFIGIAPTLYGRLFDMRPRKDKRTGYILSWEGDASEPRIRGSHKSYLANENALLAIVRDTATESGLIQGDSVPAGGGTDDACE